MSKWNSTQPETFAQKLLAKWAIFCVKFSWAILAVTVLFALAGYIATYFLWFPYSSPVSQLPKNFDERLAWEETSRLIQFNSEVMLRVSIPEPNPLLHSFVAEQRLNAAVDLLTDKLSDSKKYFRDVLSSRDLQVPQTRTLRELPEGDLQMLYAELQDARLVLGGRWELLESVNFADWLTARLNQTQADMATNTSQTVLLQNRRILQTAARFAEGLRHNFLQPRPLQNDKHISPWQLDPDRLFAKADTANGISGNTKDSSETTVIIWAKLAEPQLSNLLDRRVIGKQKKVDHQLVGKLNASMVELEHIVESARLQFGDVTIEPFGVPVDVWRSQTTPLPFKTGGILFLFAVLSLFLVAGIGHFRFYLMILVSTICSYGTYLGFCALWFEIVTPFELFLGITVPLFGVCAGILQAKSYFNARCEGLSTGDATVEMMHTAGKSILSGGLISVAVFLAGVFYLWFYPVEPTSATLSFRSSLVGINLALFLLAHTALACLVGQLTILPALLQIADSNHRVVILRYSNNDETQDTLTAIMPPIPLSVCVLLTFVLFGGFLYFVSRPNTTTSRTERYFVTASDMQAAKMPILVSGEWFDKTKCVTIPGLFACDASHILAKNDDANKSVLIDNISRTLGHTTAQQVIPLPDQRALHQSLGALYRQLAMQFTTLKNNATLTAMNTSPLQDDLRLCQKAGEELIAVCRILSQLAPADFSERIDAWQQATARDLLLQHKHLQGRLQNNRPPEMALSSVLSKRFLGSDRQSLVWLFPVENWQSAASPEDTKPTIDLLLARDLRYETQSNQLLSSRGGFPLLVLNGRQLMRWQLPVVGAVTLVVLLTMIVVVHRSVPMGAMTVLTILGGVSLYGAALLTLDIPFGKTTLIPIAFFPLVLPLFLDLFSLRCRSPDHFKPNIGATLVCFGVGVVIAGHLMFFADAAMVTAGRAMTIGWVALMMPLLVNLISVLHPDHVTDKPPTTGVTSVTTRTNHAAPTRQHEEILHGEAMDADESVYSEPESVILHETTITWQETVPIPETITELVHNNRAPEHPPSLATRDQLEFYRERIESTRIFDQQPKITTNPQVAEPDAPPCHPSAINDLPRFPAVWNVGSHHHTIHKIVLEHTDEALINRQVISLASSIGRLITRKSQKIVLTVKQPHSSQDESSANDTESPTILPMHKPHKTGDKTSSPSHRKSG